MKPCQYHRGLSLIQKSGSICLRTRPDGVTRDLYGGAPNQYACKSSAGATVDVVPPCLSLYNKGGSVEKRTWILFRNHRNDGHCKSRSLFGLKVQRYESRKSREGGRPLHLLTRRPPHDSLTGALFTLLFPGLYRKARLYYHSSCDAVAGNLEADSCGHVGARPQPCRAPWDNGHGPGLHV